MSPNRPSLAELLARKNWADVLVNPPLILTPKAPPWAGTVKENTMNTFDCTEVSWTIAQMDAGGFIVHTDDSLDAQAVSTFDEAAAVVRARYEAEQASIAAAEETGAAQQALNRERQQLLHQAGEIQRRANSLKLDDFLSKDEADVA